MSDEESPKMEILDRYFGHSLSKDILDQSFKKNVVQLSEHKWNLLFYEQHFKGFIHFTGSVT